MNDNDDQYWATHYRLGANKARRWAKAAKSETMRRMLLKLAVEYEVLATERERTIGLKNSTSD